MNHIGFIPKRTLGPISYQPLRAGQFRGYGGCNVFPSNNTVINNNIFNGGMMSGGCCDYNNYGCNNNNDMPSAFKWMMGLGIGTTLLGGILNMFGIGGGGGGRKIEEDAGDDGAGDDNVNTTRSTSEVDVNAQKMHDAEIELASTLKALGLDPTKGKVLQDGAGNLTYVYDGTTFASMDALREHYNKPTASAVPPDVPDATPAPAEEVPEAPATSSTSGSTKHSKPAGLAGWYKAANDLQLGLSKPTTVTHVGNGEVKFEDISKSKTPAQTLVDNILKTKLGDVLTDANKADLKQEIIKKNPSVFEKDGKLKAGADFSKLDVPTKEWMETKYKVQVTRYGDDGKNIVKRNFDNKA